MKKQIYLTTLMLMAYVASEAQTVEAFNYKRKNIDKGTEKVTTKNTYNVYYGFAPDYIKTKQQFNEELKLINEAQTPDTVIEITAVKEVNIDSIKKVLGIEDKPLPIKPIKYYRQMMNDVSPVETSKLELWGKLIAYEKDRKTLDFLTTNKRPKALVFGEIGNYNYNKLNDYFYGNKKSDLFRSVSVQNLTNSNSLINAELADYFFGPVRLSLDGSTKTTPDTSIEQSKGKMLQRILSTGGSVSASFSLPLYFARSRNEGVHFGLFAHSKWGVNPNLENEGETQTLFSDDITFTSEQGIMLHLDAGSNDNRLAKLVLDMPFYYVFGSSLGQVQLPDFAFIQMRTGIIVSEYYSLIVSGVLWSSSDLIRRQPFGLTLSVSPSKIIQNKQEQAKEKAE